VAVSLASNGLRFLSMGFERGQEMSTPLLGTLVVLGVMIATVIVAYFG
jgi:hypothetical protein